MEITFHGATRTTTGSIHLIETDCQRILLDCGLYQGKRSEAFERNAHLPFDPKSITPVILSHAHIDHSGNLPTLVKNGYAGEINCTTATRDLATLMLRDSAHIQEQDAAYLNQKTSRRGLPQIEPLYTMEDADHTELLNWVSGAKESLQGVFVVHGEPESALAFADALRPLGKFAVTVPELSQTIEL